MPKYDAAFSAMEKFEMQAQWLAVGCVLSLSRATGLSAKASSFDFLAYVLRSSTVIQAWQSLKKDGGLNRRDPEGS